MSWAGVERVARNNPTLVDLVREEVADRGPISARQLEYQEERTRDNWGWNWSSVKTVMEWLFYTGDITSARRNSQFERVYDLPERVLPQDGAPGTDARRPRTRCGPWSAGRPARWAWAVRSVSGTTSGPDPP